MTREFLLLALYIHALCARATLREGKEEEEEDEEEKACLTYVVGVTHAQRARSTPN
jgi:hypothetical protein